jgi:hypothetical protein
VYNILVDPLVLCVNLREVRDPIIVNQNWTWRWHMYAETCCPRQQCACWKYWCVDRNVINIVCRDYQFSSIGRRYIVESTARSTRQNVEISNTELRNENRCDEFGTCSVIINSNSFTDTSCTHIPTVVNGRQLWSHILHDQYSVYQVAHTSQL